MSNRFENILWFLVIAIFFGVAIYLYLCAPSAAFWEATVGGLISTAVALIAGIPIALSIDRAIKKKDHDKNKADKRNREKELLKQLNDELEVCKSFLEKRIENPKALYIQPFKTDLWHAISSAGLLGLISSPFVLGEISDAYYIIDTVRNIEELGYKASRSATVSFGGGKTATEILFEDARTFDDAMREHIGSAISAIQEDLGGNGA